jgi:hypothetical protein
MSSKKYALVNGKPTAFALLTPDQVITAQRMRYDEILTTDTSIVCEPLQDTSIEIKVSDLGVFHSETLTGTYTTLNDTGSAIVDNGVCPLAITIKDGANALPLTNGYVSLDLMLSPGRVRSSLATNNLTTAAPSSTLFYPMKFDYYFPKLSSIQMVIRNTSNTRQVVQLAFHGERVRGVVSL